jgi:hypothetical protein
MNLESMFQAALAVLLYWPLIALLSFEASLRFRTQLAAMAVSMLIVLAFAAIPLGMDIAWRFDSMYGYDVAFWIEPFAPYTLVPPNRSPRGLRYVPLQQLATMLAHVFIYVAALYLLRGLIPREFVRACKRCESTRRRPRVVQPAIEPA